MLTPEEMDKAYVLFAAAEKAAAGDPGYVKRIQEEKLSLLMVDLNQRNPMKGLGGINENTFAKRLAEFLALYKGSYKNFVFYSYPIDRWLMDIARIKVDAVNWRNDLTLNAFLKNPENTLRFDENGQSQVPAVGVCPRHIHLAESIWIIRLRLASLSVVHRLGTT